MVLHLYILRFPRILILLSSSGEGHFETSVSPRSEDDATQEVDFTHVYPLARCGLIFPSLVGPMHRLTVAVLLTCKFSSSLFNVKDGHDIASSSHRMRFVVLFEFFVW